jgi:hypothetical protein
MTHERFLKLLQIHLMVDLPLSCIKIDKIKMKTKHFFLKKYKHHP